MVPSQSSYFFWYVLKPDPTIYYGSVTLEQSVDDSNTVERVGEAAMAKYGENTQIVSSINSYDGVNEHEAAD